MQRSMDAAFSQMLERALNWECTQMYARFYNNLLRSVKNPEVRLTSYLLLLGHLNTCSKAGTKPPLVLSPLTVLRQLPGLHQPALLTSNLNKTT